MPAQRRLALVASAVVGGLESVVSELVWGVLTVLLVLALRSHGGALVRRPRSGSWLPWSPALTLACAGSILWSTQPALAHTSLVSSSPAPSAVVVDPVAAVTLVFSQPVSSRQVQVVVHGPDGADVGLGPARVSGGIVRRSVDVGPMSGDFLLAYRVLAEDGHPITGQVPFRIAVPAAGSAPTTTATATVPPTGPGAAQTEATAPRPAGTALAPVLVAVLSGLAVVLLVGALRAGRRAEVGR